MLLQSLHYSRNKVRYDNNLVDAAAKSSFGAGVNGNGITIGRTFFDFFAGGAYHSFLPTGAFAYNVTLTARQSRAWGLLHELGHSTGRLPADWSYVTQDANDRYILDNCILPAIKAGII